MSVPTYNRRTSATMNTNPSQVPRRNITPHPDIGHTAASYATPNEMQRPRTRGMGYPQAPLAAPRRAVPTMGMPTPVFGSRAVR